MGRWEVARFGSLGWTDSGAPGPVPADGVRVAVGASSLNYRDLLMLQGRYDPRLPLPYVPLSDLAGTVLEVGAGVRSFAPGDLVCATFSPSWIDGAPDADALRRTRGGPLPGFAADEVVVPERDLVRAPAGWSAAEASTLPCAGVTAWSAVVDHGQVRPGGAVLVQGTGGVSLFALAIAKAAGARVYAVTTTPSRVEVLRGLGAERVWCTADEPRWGRAVRKVTGGGVDLVVEVGGSGTLGESVDAARIGGTVALIGNLAPAAPVDTVAILMKQVRVQGVFVGPRRAFEDLVRAAALHPLRPVIDRVFPFPALPEAFAHVEARAHVGKVVVQRG
jgi:NADPH:quinone reductase-like Zn-dependent oxidoreductase